MTQVMAYATLLSACVAALVAAADPVLRLRRRTARWLWLAGLVAAASLSAAVMVIPRAQPQEPVPVVASQPSGPQRIGPVVTSAASGISLVHVDAALTFGWLVSSALLFVALMGSSLRMKRHRHGARRTEVLGTPVFLTEDVGPAVAGFARPAIFVPWWVLDLDERAQRLLITHELEHLRAGDSRLMALSAVAVALLPWNPVLWWMAARLRLAIECDCDARVLRKGPHVRAYARLLLSAAGRPASRHRWSPALLSERSSDLERRIEAMTDRNAGHMWRRTMGAAVAATSLIVLACDTRRPEPVAPITSVDWDRRAAVLPQDTSAIARLTRLELLYQSAVAMNPDLSRPDSEAPVVLVLSNDGELRSASRDAGQSGPLSSIQPRTIENVEVIKGRLLPPAWPGGLIVVTLKAAEQGSAGSRRDPIPGSTRERANRESPTVILRSRSGAKLIMREPSRERLSGRGPAQAIAPVVIAGIREQD